MRLPWLVLAFAGVVLAALQSVGDEPNALRRLEQERDELQAKEAELNNAKGNRDSNMLDQRLLDARIDLQYAKSEIARLKLEQAEEVNKLVPEAIQNVKISQLKFERDREALLLRRLELSAQPHDPDDLLHIDVEIAACEVNLTHVAISAVRRNLRRGVSNEELQRPQSSYVEAVIRHHFVEKRANSNSP